ncbi:signal transduction histidine kinase [Thioalbus denitrificans]|uniref:Sensory/regulatory protein RpfC n=2 Tax=Thioalbus denitrificans TaxID=547122 RepID=A0A369CJ54_9GAMM|nr:signal transduction histidine kinase [Thioalbus denitrificans]
MAGPRCAAWMETRKGYMSTPELTHNGTILPTIAAESRPVEDHAAELLAARVSMLYDQAAKGFLATLVAAAVLAFLLVERLDYARVTGWLLAVVFIIAARYATLVAYRRTRPGPGEAARWMQRFSVGTLFSGLAWGIAGVLLFPPQSIPHQAFLALILAGLVAGAVPVLALSMRTLAAFTVLCLTPAMLQFFAQETDIQRAMGFMFVVYMVFMLSVAWRINQSMTRSLQLGFENIHLVDYLRSAKDASEQLNEGLKAEISERRKIETALKQAKEEAEQASRAKGEFLATMSHEIRTPMNGVLGTLELLADMPLGEEQRDLVSTAQSSAESLLTIINDVLDFSKIEVGQLDLEDINFDLRRTVSEVCALMGKRAEAKGVKVKWSVPERFGTQLRGDPTRLRQILLNLVGNAVKFTERGFIEVRASVLRETRADVILRLEVEDSGIGMTPQVQAQLFRPFTQGDQSMARKFGGTGLGLSIAKRLVELMGGQIGLNSQEGVGSTFWFTIRLGKPVTSSGRVRVDLRGTRVLLVIDNPETRDSIENLLRRWGASFDSADNALEAIDKLNYSARIGLSWLFDAAIIDSKLRGTDPLRLSRQIKDNRIFSPVVLLLLGSSGDTDAELDAGFEGVLAQPLRSAELFHLLATLTREPINRDTYYTGGMVPLETPQRSASEPYPATPEPADTEPPARLSGHILLVEDNPVNQSVARTMLQRLGLSVDLANNGREGVRALESGRFDVVLMDCQMPEMDGFEATAAIRRREKKDGRARQPVIAMTANAMEGDRQRCIAAGMDDYLAKPVKQMELRRMLHQWLQRTATSATEGQPAAAAAPAQPRPAGRSPLELPDLDLLADGGTTAPAAGTPPAESPAPAPAPSTETLSGRILLVEDDATNQKLARAMLTKLGLMVDMADNGRQGLHAVFGSHYDAVLMDCQMPEMDGFEATAGIRRQEQLQGLPRIPIIAMTANAMEGDRERCLEAGMDDYLSKPVKRSQLADTLRKWLPEPAHPTGPGLDTMTQTEAPSPRTPAVDKAVLVELREIMEDAFAELIQTYLRDTPTRLVAIRDAIDKTDADALRAAAHTMKSSSANLGAMPLSALAKELEALGRSGTTEGAAELFRSAAAEYTRVKQALEASL